MVVAVASLVFGTVGVAVAGLPPGGSFSDDDGNIHEANIEAIAAEGITKGCNPSEGNTKYCPGSSVTRGQMAAFLVRALKLPATSTDFFSDDDGSVFEANINRLAASGITKGCNPSEGNTKYCPDGKVTRGQMAAFLVRAFSYADDGGGGLFTDTAESIFASNIDRLATAGVTKGCNPAEGNTRYCPNDLVKRDQMASFLARALKLAPIVPPPPPPPPPPPSAGCSRSDIGIPVSECNALVAIYNATNGDSWTYNTFWFDSGSLGRPCYWKGVECSGPIDGQVHVWALNLGSNNLTGTLPPQIGDFPYLAQISLQGNNLAGTLPAELGNLSSLKNLRVNANLALGGEIPIAIYTGLKDTLIQFSIGGTPGGIGTARCYSVPSNAPAGMVPWLESVSRGQWADASC